MDEYRQRRLLAAVLEADAEAERYVALSGFMSMAEILDEMDRRGRRPGEPEEGE